MISELMRRMTEAGAPIEAVMIAVEAIESLQRAEQDRRDKRAAQKRKERGVDVHVARLSRDVEATVAPMSRDKERPHTPKENPPLPSPPKGGSVRPPRGGSEDVATLLAEVVSQDTVCELIAHRKAMKCPLTNGSAKGLAKQLVASGDAEAAAATMMTSGWRGYRADWAGQHPRAGPAAAAPRTNHYFDGITGRKPYEHLQHGHGAGGSEQPPDQAFGNRANGHPTLEAVRAPGWREDVFDIPELGALGGGARKFG